MDKWIAKLKKYLRVKMGGIEKRRIVKKDC